jgi:hypothetical protein
MTKQIDILSNETKNVKAISPVTNKEAKQEASLFDKLLGGAVKTSSEENKTSSSTSTLKSDSNISSDVKKEEIINPKILKEEKNIASESKDMESKVPVKSSSLLDRLVLEANKHTKENDTVKNVETSPLIKSTQVNTDVEDINVKSELKNNEVKNINIDNTKEVSKIVEPKIDIKNEETRNENIIKKDTVKNIITPQVQQVVSGNSEIEETNVKTELKTNEVPRVITPSLEENKTSLSPSATKLDSNISSDVEKEEIANPKVLKEEKNILSESKDMQSKVPIKSSSLLDRLVLEANKHTKESDAIKNIETSPLKSIETNTETQKINVKTELKTNEVKNTNIDNTKEVSKIVEPKIDIKNEEIKNENTIKKDVVKDTITSQVQQVVSGNSEIEETIVKTELKTNEVKNINIDNTKTVEKVASNNTDIKNIETSQIKQSVQVSSEKEEINTKTELKTNTVQELVLNKLEVKNTDIIKKDAIKNTEISPTIQSTKVNSTVEEINTNENKNTKLGNDLASLNKDNKSNEKINITKNEIESLVTKQKEEPKSLMDSLLEKTKTLKNQTSISQDESITLKNTNNSSKDVISNIYLSSQRNSINNTALSNKTEAVNSVKNATTTAEIEVNAKKLDLNIKDISLETKALEVKKESINLIDRKNSLDKIILNKNARHNEVNTLITKSVEASKAILEDSLEIDSEVSLNVNSSLAQSIQTRIIGARQQMSGMMSDVARQMYENYKPPVTAFRISLNPGTLGSIAIVMKSDKDSGINISLNISNSSTLDAFIDSQNNLKNALNKTFDEGTKFNLDFSSSNQNNDKSGNKEDTNQSFSNKSDTQSILESREKNLESEDRNIDYM